MSTYAKPKNQNIKEVKWNIAGAELLREIVGESPYISGAGSNDDFISEETAREFGNAINAYTDANPNHENYAWLMYTLYVVWRVHAHIYVYELKSISLLSLYFRSI